MRFSSKPAGGYTVFAVSGIYSISFAISADPAFTDGLLGFSIERYDPHEDQRYWMYNMKVFREIVKHPKPDEKYSSYDHPVQSFVWDDFTAKPDREYVYYFHPVKGRPKNLRRGEPIEIKVRTEPKYSKKSKHAIFFNRGVASSQAYVKEFGYKNPYDMPDDKRQKALTWLSRGLDEALLKFINDAQEGDSLRGAFYEFHYSDVLEALADAIDRGVDVKIIYDAKDNSSTDKKGNFHEAFPREANRKAIRSAKLPKSALIPREANETHIHHNKFIVFSKGGNTPTSVWTGSANISEGGIFGQTNVGHQIHDETLATKYLEYWNLLSKDPGAQPGDDRKTRKKDNDDYKEKVVGIQDDIPEEEIDEYTSRRYTRIQSANNRYHVKDLC